MIQYMKRSRFSVKYFMKRKAIIFLSTFQAAWMLKTRALTELVYVDEIEVDEQGIAEMSMDDNAVAQVARPGTSLKVVGTAQGGPSQGVRLVLSLH